MLNKIHFLFIENCVAHSELYASASFQKEVGTEKVKDKVKECQKKKISCTFSY